VFAEPITACGSAVAPRPPATAPAPSASQSDGDPRVPGFFRRRFIRLPFVCIFLFLVDPAGRFRWRLFFFLAILFFLPAGFTRAYKAPVFFRFVALAFLALPFLRLRFFLGAFEAEFVCRRFFLGAAGFVRGRWCDFAAGRFLRLRFREALAAAFWRLLPKYLSCFALIFLLAIFRFPFFAGFAILVTTVASAITHPSYFEALQGLRR
jgi:hypothetical protein